MLFSLFNPRSIAIIGASSREMHIGNRIIKNLLHFGYKGNIYPINPNAKEICGLRAYSSILEVDDVVDVAHIVIPAKLVPSVIEDCGKKRVKNVIINSGGFAEVGEEGQKIQYDFMRRAKKYGVRVLGPNCQGIINSDKDIRAYCNFTFTFSKSGNISIIALSGGVGELIHQNFACKGVGIRMYVSSGNSCDISMLELLKYIGEDEQTKVIVIYTEGLRDSKLFMEEAIRITPKKPILAMKAGRTVAGAKAAASHTGMLVHKDISTELIFKKSGIISFEIEKDMIDAAIVLSSQPIPMGKRVGIITNTGGPAVIASDVLVENGFEVPQLSNKSIEFLKSNLHKGSSINNPVDVLATGTEEHYKYCLDAMINDENVDIIFIVLVTPFFVNTEDIAKEIGLINGKALKPMVCNFITDLEVWDITDKILKDSNVPCFALPSSAAKALVSLEKYRDIREIKKSTIKDFKDVKFEVVSNILYLNKVKKQNYLGAKDVYDILDGYSIKVPNWKVVSSIDTALEAANSIGYPVAIKVDSEFMIHKSDIGGVVLNLSNSAELEKAIIKLRSKFGTEFKNFNFLIQKYVLGGLELILGAKAISGLGHALMFGLGGIFVEVLSDIVLGLTPVSETEARNMINSIRNKKILSDFRGRKGVNVELIVELIQRLSRLLCDFPGIEELDFNPVLVSEDKIRVLDARIFLKK